VIGVVLVLVRYIRNRHWLDLFLLVSIPFAAAVHPFAGISRAKTRP
jgi:hypothetical protein